MRIDAYNQIAQLYGVSRTTKTAKTQSASRMSDQVSISQAGRDYQTVTRLRKKQYQRLRTSGKIKSICLRTW